MLMAVLNQGWREPGLTIEGTPEELAALPSLLCDPGSRPLAQLEDRDRTLWVDVVVVEEDEPLDDIGQHVLRATVVAEVTDEHSPYIAWVFGIPPSGGTTELIGSIAADALPAGGTLAEFVDAIASGSFWTGS